MPRWLEQWIVGTTISLLHLSLLGAWCRDWLIENYAPTGLAWSALCLVLAGGGAWALFDDTFQGRN
jgi:hypothetical protein